MCNKEMQSRLPHHRVSRRDQRGVSLLELMVGLVVGLICVLIIVQLQALWDARKRAVVAGNDAQISGTLGAFALDRDLRLAGFGIGMADSTVMGCNVHAVNTAITAHPDIGFKLVPVEIVKTDNMPDEIRVLYGNSSYFVASQPILSSTDETNTLKSREGFRVGDRAIAANNTGTCHLVEITGLSLTDPNALEHKAGVTYTTLTNTNQTATMNASGGLDPAITAGLLFSLGPAPSRTVWKVSLTRQSLTRYNSLAGDDSSATDVVSDVVTLKAQYGYDASGDGMIGASEWYDALPSVPDYTRLLAVRFGLLMRSRQYERANMDTGTPVTASAPTWGGGSIAFAMRNVDNTNDSGGSADAVSGASAPNNWRNYRYRVYDVVVPLRNMIWGTAP